MANCTDCNKKYQAYLSDLPSAWRNQIADLMCRVVNDAGSLSCADFKACETVTSLLPFTLDEDELSISYIDERGITTTRSVTIPSFSGDFISNQFASGQVAEFWITGRSRVGNIDIIDSTIPSNGLNLPATDTLGLVAGGSVITTIEATDGLMTHSGNIFLDASISSEPSISFFLNSLAASDYFIQRSGTILDFHAAGIAQISVSGGRGYTANANVNQGHEWYSMDVSDNNVMQLFPDGCLHIETTTVQQNSDPCAILKVVSTSRGVLFPNMTTAQKNAISSPKSGLVIFDTDLQKLCVYTTIWETISSS